MLAGSLVLLASACEKDPVRPEARQLVLSPPALELEVGDTLRMQARGTDQFGDAIEGNVEWSSSDPSTVRVAPDGLVTAVAGPGWAEITARLDRAVASATISTVPAAVAAVQIAPSFVSLRRGEETQLSATARDRRGVALSDRAITYRVLDPQVATVSAGGRIAAIANGSTSVIASVEDRADTIGVSVHDVATSNRLVSVASGDFGDVPLHVGSALSSPRPVSGGLVDVATADASAQVILATDAEGKLRGLTLGISGEAGGTSSLSALSTLTTLMMLTPGLATSHPDSAAARVSRLRALPCVVTTANLLRTHLVSEALPDAVLRSDVADALTSCISTAVEAAAPAVVWPPQAQLVDRTGPRVTVSRFRTDGQRAVRVSNNGWRFVQVLRRRRDGSIESIGRMGGGMPLGVGAALTGTFDTPTVEVDDGNTARDGGPLEYWIVGPGRAASAALPADAPGIDDVDLWGATITYYVAFPILDMLAGGGVRKLLERTGSSAEAIRTLQEAATVGFAAVRQTTGVLELSSQLSNATEQRAVARTMIDLGVAVLGSLATAGAATGAVGAIAASVGAVIGTVGAAVGSFNVVGAGVGILTSPRVYSNSIPAVPAAAVSLAPTELRLSPGAQGTIVGTIVGEDGIPITASQLTWASDDAQVARVDDHGRVTAGDAAGTTFVSATIGQLSANAEVVVSRSSTGRGLVLLNDVNVFDDTRMATAGNVQFLTNLLRTPLAQGPRATGNTVWMDVGRSSRLCTSTASAICPANPSGNFRTMRSVIGTTPPNGTAGGFSLEFIASGADADVLNSIPDSVRVLVLWTPHIPFASAEVQGLRAFVEQGGTLILFGEHYSFYGDYLIGGNTGSSVQNGLLAALGSEARYGGGAYNNGGLLTDNLSEHPLMEGVQRLMLAASASVTTSTRDQMLFRDRNGAVALGALVLFGDAALRASTRHPETSKTLRQENGGCVTNRPDLAPDCESP